jgi:hypothetical protein
LSETVGLSVEGFAIHAQEGSENASLRGSLVGHFDLPRRDGAADGLRVMFAGEVDTAGSEAAADIEDF